jgi:hypothetical protein
VCWACLNGSCTRVRGEKRKAEEGGDNDHERELEEIMGPKKRLKIDSKTQDILVRWFLKIGIDAVCY